MADAILAGAVSAADDPMWRHSGARTAQEYLRWSWNSCGMACLKMILAAHLHEPHATVTLAERCTVYGGYRANPAAAAIGDYHNYYDGLFYRPFLSFVRTAFNLDGRIRSPLSLESILSDVSNGHYVIASVSAAIRHPEGEPDNRGHLVLVVGYDINEDLLFLHNPSGYYNKSQTYAPIGFAAFMRFFNRRGIVIISGQ